MYLDNVTVDQNSENIELTWHGENTHDIVEYNIHRSDNNIDFNQLFTEPNTASSFETKVDYSADPNTQSYYYQIEGLNKCNEVVVQSQVSQSIFLTLEPINDHNEYINWSGGVEEYQLQKENNVSTWNIIQSSSMPITQKPYNDSSGCYRILATEIINQFGHSQTSYSNVVCVIDELKAFVTTAINPTSENNTFKIIGEGIDHSKSSYQIFNRWGEMIAEQPTNQSWDATYQGTQVPPGVYVYIVNLTGLLGETETQKGIVNVIR